MPKASLHHVHLDAILPSEWFYKRAIEDPNLYVNDKITRVRCFYNNPSEGFAKLIDKRSQATDKEDFDAKLKLAYEVTDEDTNLDDVFGELIDKYINRLHISNQI